MLKTIQEKDQGLSKTDINEEQVPNALYQKVRYSSKDRAAVYLPNIKRVVSGYAHKLIAKDFGYRDSYAKGLVKIYIQPAGEVIRGKKRENTLLIISSVDNEEFRDFTEALLLAGEDLDTVIRMNGHNSSLRELKERFQIE